MTDETNKKGNDFYRSGDFQKAVSCYQDALLAENKKEKPDKTALVNLYNNSAQCYLKLEKYADAVEQATQCIWLEDNTKAMYRRCQAYEHLGQTAEAYKEAVVLHYLEPKKSLFTQLLETLDNKMKEARAGNQEFRFSSPKGPYPFNATLPSGTWGDRDDVDNEVNVQNHTVLFAEVCEKNKPESVRQFLTKQLDLAVRVRGEHGAMESLLDMAVRKDFVCVVKLLASDERVLVHNGHLLRVCNSDSGAEIARVLIEIGGVDVDKEVSGMYADIDMHVKNTTTLMHFLMIYHPLTRGEINHELLDCILKHSDVNAKQSFHLTPLTLALSHCSYEILWKIIKAGADLDQVDDSGDDAFRYVLSCPSYRTVDDIRFGGAKMLLEGRMMKGLNECDKNGNSCLMYAISADPLVGPPAGGSDHIIVDLIDRGIDVNIRNEVGENAMMMLMKRNYYGVPPGEIFNKLLLAGADTSVVDKRGKTALYHALRQPWHNCYSDQLLENRTQLTLWELRVAIDCGTPELLRKIVTTGRALPIMFQCEFLKAMHRDEDFDFEEKQGEEDDLVPLSPLMQACVTAMRDKDTSKIEILISARFINTYDMTFPWYLNEMLEDYTHEDQREVRDAVTNFYCQPRSLMNLCFVKISSCLGPDQNRRREKVSKLFLPVTLKNALCFNIKCF